MKKSLSFLLCFIVTFQCFALHSFANDNSAHNSINAAESSMLCDEHTINESFVTEKEPAMTETLASKKSEMHTETEIAAEPMRKENGKIKKTTIAQNNTSTRATIDNAQNHQSYITSIEPIEPSVKVLTLAVCQSGKILINVLPKSAAEHIMWKIADKTIASTTQNGVVTGKKPGKTTLTVAATDGSNQFITYKIIITPRKTGNYLNVKNCTVVKTNRTIYPYGQMCKDIVALKKAYPYLFKFVSLGKSYDNRHIFEIIIGNQNAKNKILVQASIHAREYNNSRLVMRQTEALCANYYSGTYKGRYYNELLENCCFYIIPMMNPDGVNISIYGAKGIQNKTLRNNVIKMCQKYSNGSASYYTQWKANARGVDLNRNWNCNRAKKALVNYACSAEYKGHAAESEKETKILKKEFETIEPGMVISYHSTGSVIYWDFLQKGTLQRKCADLFKIVHGLTGYHSADNPSARGASLSELGLCFGDWVAHVKKTPTLTIETGSVPCPIAAKYFPAIWKENQHLLPAIGYYALNDTVACITSLKAVTNAFVLTTYKSNAKSLTYEIAYSKNANFKNARYMEFPANSGILKVTNLKGKYYICIRTVKKYGAIKYYGRWSASKTIMMK